MFVPTQEEFLPTYPFRKYANQSLWPFLRWQIVCALPFVSLEFFCRSYLLKALSHRFGSGGILVMLVPYGMIHFAKPVPETLGAIIAGRVLGTLAMRTRSIWGGPFMHRSVVLTIDGIAVAPCPPAAEGPCPSD